MRLSSCISSLIQVEICHQMSWVTLGNLRSTCRPTNSLVVTYYSDLEPCTRYILLLKPNRTDAKSWKFSVRAKWVYYSRTAMQDCNRDLSFFRYDLFCRSQQMIDSDMKIKTVSIMTGIRKMQQDAQERHQEVLKMIQGLSDTTSSDRASSVGKFHYFKGIQHWESHHR